MSIPCIGIYMNRRTDKIFLWRRGEKQEKKPNTMTLPTQVKEFDNESDRSDKIEQGRIIRSDSGLCTEIRIPSIGIRMES